MRTHRAYSTARRSQCPTWQIPESLRLWRLFGGSPPSTARPRPPRAGRRPPCGRLIASAFAGDGLLTPALGFGAGADELPRIFVEAHLAAGGAEVVGLAVKE